MISDPYDDDRPTRAECERDEHIVGRMRNVREADRQARIAEIARMDPFDPANQRKDES